MSKPGRNDPCPCGSGKKYKKCCYLKDSDPKNRALKMKKELMDDLYRYVIDYYEEELENVKDDFYDPYYLSFGGNAVNFHFHILNWFVYDWRDENYYKRGIIEQYRKEYHIDVGHRYEILKEMEGSFLSLYEAESVTSDLVITVRDLFFDRRFDVSGISIYTLPAAGEMFFARLLHLGDMTVFGDDLYFMKPVQKEIIIEALKKDYAPFIDDGSSLEYCLKTYSYYLLQCWEDSSFSLAESAYDPEKGKKRFDIIDKETFEKRIQGLSKYSQIGMDRYFFIEKMEQPDDDDCMAGNLRICDNTLTLTTIEPPHLTSLTEILLADFGDLLTVVPETPESADSEGITGHEKTVSVQHRLPAESSVTFDEIMEDILSTDHSRFIPLLSAARPEMTDLYRKRYERTKKKRASGISFFDIYKNEDPVAVYDDCPEGMDAFVSAVCEEYDERIVTPSRLTELMGQTEQNEEEIGQVLEASKLCRLETAYEYGILNGVPFGKMTHADISPLDIAEDWEDYYTDEADAKFAKLESAYFNVLSRPEYSHLLGKTVLELSSITGISRYFLRTIAIENRHQRRYIPKEYPSYPPEKPSFDKDSFDALAERVDRGDYDAFIEVLKVSENHFVGSYEFHYRNIRKRISDGDSWEEVFIDEISYDDQFDSEIFVRLIEEFQGVRLTDENSLKNIFSSDSVPEKEITETFLFAMEARYHVILKYALARGATYKELMDITPSRFRLPESWEGFIRGTQDRESQIMQALALSSFYDITSYNLYNPYLKLTAAQLEMPYRLLLDAHNEFSQ